jgi:hypothetical protein
LIPPSAEQAFLVAAGDLGFASASWLFVRETAACAGDPGVSELRDALGRSFPVLDAIAAAWLDGERAPVIDADRVVAALEGARRLLIIGVEADHLDVLLPRLPPTVEVALLAYSNLEADWDRILANFGGRVRRADLGSFHELAGARSSALTFVYGHDHHIARVRAAWLRFAGADVYTQFRAFLGWNVLSRPLYVYPRWLHDHPVSAFTSLVSG